MQEGHVRISWPSVRRQEITLPLPMPSILAFQQLVQEHFKQDINLQEYIFTDTSKDLVCDGDVQQLADGAHVFVVSKKDRSLGGTARERVSFQPHPKTMTAAGDYEYFAAQGRHPFVYALAEFIDNSLRATRANAPRPRSIDVSLIVTGTSPSTAKGLVCIADNGCGMSKKELNEWAVMNYSMEERGQAPQEPEVHGRGAVSGAGRFLTGDISYFGVGSKNAAFFMGSTVKVCTQRDDESYVHELELAADALEQRYRNKEAVYEEEMVHRNPGDCSTLSVIEQPFSLTRQWVEQEMEGVGDSGRRGFTRVLIGDLKPEVLRLILEDEGGESICQELAHLYHYYLHGESGNRQPLKGPREGRLPNGEPFPQVSITYSVDAKVIWSKQLVEVDDDMETRYLRTQKSEMTFSLDVPGKGTVCGVLYYFPYENDHETVPLENPTTSTKPFSSPGTGAGLTQVALSQMAPRGTQNAPRMTQQARGDAAAGESEDEESGFTPWQSPIFEAFWQGRLIPGARIDTLPFMEIVRQKRNAQIKDIVPDEAFLRLRGSLFLGPAFRVTRNKLLFRDNLQELLATAVPGDRSLEKKFKDWLARCHATLDKSIRFEALADSKSQAMLRSKLGEGITVFNRITDGNRTVSSGDIVRINVKPVLVGRVVAFTVPQVVREEGCYPSGRVEIDVLPSEVYGSSCRRDFSLRRIDGVLGEKELKDYVTKEMLKAPSAVRLEPMNMATGKVLELTAGATLPATTVSVLNGAGQRMTKGQCAGDKVSLVVTQKLWHLKGGASDADFIPGHDLETVAEEPVDEELAAAVRPTKRARKGRKGGKGQAAGTKQDENADPAPNAGACPQSKAGVLQEMLLCVENKTPNKECFQFSQVEDGLQLAGQYALEYTVTPALPGQEAMSLVVHLLVKAGKPCSLCMCGEGKALLATKEVALGARLPPLKLILQDCYGNHVVDDGVAQLPRLALHAAIFDENENVVRCEELVVNAEQEVHGGCVVLKGVQIYGCKEAETTKQGLQLFSRAPCSTRATARQAQQAPSQEASVGRAQIMLCIEAEDREGGGNWGSETLSILLIPGAPKSIRLLPGNPWDEGDGSDVSLQCGQELPGFQVACFDAWGNATGPSSVLDFKLNVECNCTTPASLEVPFSRLGVASIAGVTASKPNLSESLNLKLDYAPADSAAEAAVQACQPAEMLRLPLQLTASALPVCIQLLWGEEPVPVRQSNGEDGAHLVASLEGIPAGSQVQGLKMMLLDEGGLPAKQCVAGKITASWKKGSKKVSWEGEPVKLPSFQAPFKVKELATEWVRFMSNSPPLTLDISLELKPAASEPTAWKGHVVLEDHQEFSQSVSGYEKVRCGEPFLLRIEAKDAFENRRSSNRSPTPVVAVQGDASLEYSEQEWEQGWVSQGGDEVYDVRMKVAGPLGNFSIQIQDAAGSDGTSLLAEDILPLELIPGPPTFLCFDGANAALIESGLKAVLHQLCVRVCDISGNPTTSGSTFEVSLNSSALAVDGSGAAAAVTVAGGNKAKLKAGFAVFKEVRIAAEHPGRYALRVQSASRKVAVQEGTLAVHMTPQNVVVGLSVQLPEDQQIEAHPAGSAAELLVTIETQDGQPLPVEDAVSGLSLKLTAPDGSPPVVISLPQPESCGSGENTFVFPLGELRLSGAYTAVAEYTESRAAILAGLSKKESSLRSSAVQLPVKAGPPVTLAVEAAGLRDKIAATNGQSSRQRLLLHNAAVQLKDAYDNAAACQGVQIRFQLRHQQQDGSEGEAPQLQEAEGGALLTDEQGRAFFGDLHLAQGSGSAGPAGSLECQLLCEALGLYPSPTRDPEIDEEGWEVCWACPVIFSDDAARYAALEQLSSRREVLIGEREQLQGRVRQAWQAAEEAMRDQQQFAKSLAKKAKSFPGPPPTSAQEAQQRAQQLLQEQEKAEETAVKSMAAPVRPARYGAPKQALTHAINKIVQSGDEGVVGVMARLATIDDEPLARIVSAQFRGLLGVVVLADMQCRERLVKLLTQHKFPVPDMLALTQTQPHRGPAEGDIPGFATAGALPKRLVHAACVGTDKPVPTPLPHAKVLTMMKERGGARHELGIDDWPEGCLGYVYNLVRPATRGHRAGILAGLMGPTLVFETLPHASAYREYMTQKLRSGLSDVVCLDGTRITGRGIVSGSSFQPAPLDRTDYCFGGTPHGQNPARAESAAELEALQEWVDIAGKQEIAAQEAEQAQNAAQLLEQELESEVGRLENKLAELDAQLGLAKLGDPPGITPASGCRREGRGTKQRLTNGDMVQDAVEKRDIANDEDGAGGRSKRRRTTRNG